MISKTLRILTFSQLQHRTWYLLARKRNPQTYYSILQVDPTASPQQIKHSYVQLVKKYHPDLTQRAPQHIRKINDAYKVLSDPAERQKYDISLQDEESLKQAEQSQGPAHRPFEEGQSPQDSQPRNVYQGWSLLHTFMMGAVLTTVLMVIFGVPRAQRGSKQSIDQQYPSNEPNRRAYSKKEFQDDFEQSLSISQLSKKI